MNKEYLAFVKEHNISEKLATEIFEFEHDECQKYFVKLATSKVINRNALFQLRIVTGIKH